MLIGDGWAYIHIAKCGGTALRAVLNGKESSVTMPMYPRQTVSNAKHWIALERPEGRVFTVVRHPADWLRSYWAHRMARGWIDGMALDVFGTKSLSAFVMRVCANEPGYVSRMFAAYCDAYPGIEVFRLEDGLENVVRSVTGKQIKIPHKNHAKTRTKLTDEALEMVLRAERSATKRFGYDGE